MAQGGGVVSRNVGLLHDRDYFSRTLGLSDRGLNPWDASIKSIVSKEEIRDVFGVTTSPVPLRSARKIGAEFLQDLKRSVLGKDASNAVSLAFARGAIAAYRGLTVDWATFAFQAQFKGPSKRNKLRRFKQSVQAAREEGFSGDHSRANQGNSTLSSDEEEDDAKWKALDKLETSPVQGDRIEVIGGIRAQLRHVYGEQNRVEDTLLALEKAPTSQGNPRKSELAEELLGLFARQKELQQHFFEQLRLAENGGIASNPSSALELSGKHNTPFLNVKPLTTRTSHPTCLRPEGPKLKAKSDTKCEGKLKALAEVLFRGISVEKETKGDGSRLTWTSLWEGGEGAESASPKLKAKSDTKC